MFKTKEKVLIYLYRGLDILIVTAAFPLAVKLRAGMTFEPLEPFGGHLSDYTWLWVGLVLIWWHLLHMGQVYVSYRGKPIRQVLQAVLKVNFYGVVLAGFLLFVFNQYSVHRTLILMFFLACTALLMTEKVILFAFLGRLRRSNKNSKFTLIVGLGKRAAQLIDMLHRNPATGFHIIGVLGDDPAMTGKTFKGLPVIGTSDRLIRILREHVVDEVFIAISMRHMDAIKKMILDCEEHGINARITAQIYNPVKASIYVDEILDIPFITFTTHPLKPYQLYIKGIIDVVVALVLMAVLVPLGLVIALLIRLDSRGAVFFRQQRTGMNGRVFTMYKFRSMRERSEQQHQHLAPRNEMEGPVFKIRSDPRVTRIGRVLRRTSLDELPQLINVVKGDMSLIGPRPLPVYEATRITGTACRRLSMKPGMTGLWQVSGRCNVDFNRWMKLDLQYIDNWSLWLDITILMRTVYAIVSGRGAC